MKKVGKITNTWKRALQQIEAKQFNEAIETLDECLLLLALATESKIETIDNISVYL